MRATEPRRAFSIRRAGFLGALAALACAASIAACADSLHLDPPGATTGSGGSSSHSSTASHGSSSSGSGECQSNLTCSYPTALCDTVASKCVECLTLPDCGNKPGTVCSTERCLCPNLADAAVAPEYCPGPGGGAGHCVDTQTSLKDCGGCGMPCAGTCTNGSCNLGTGGATGAGGSDGGLDPDASDGG